MKPKLSAVPTELPEPPYAEDTFVKGWRFQIDHERLFASDTWALAPPDIRPWLLMIWHTAWVQMPAAAFTNDHAVIAAKIGMEPRIFTAHADILLRGFVLHSDGRIYHPLIVEQASGAYEKLKNDRERKRQYREKMKSERAENVPRTSTDVRGTSGTVRTPEPEPEPEEESLHSSDEECCPAAGAARPSPTPFSEILRIWREVLPELNGHLDVEHWTPARKALIRARWRDQLPDLDAWRECFQIVRRSKFLMGRSSAPGRKPFKCDLFWVAKPENLSKIYEGKYSG